MLFSLTLSFTDGIHGGLRRVVMRRYDHHGY